MRLWVHHKLYSTLPFTLAHPAAVLPLRRWLVFSALVVGSMAPDFHYYFYLAPDADVSHSLSGTFLYCLPAGLAVLWVFHRLLKLPIISLLPEAHAQKLMALAGDFPFTPLPRTLLIVASLLVGTSTHLLWDSVTHGGGWVVQEVPFLQTVVFPQIFGERSVFSVLQHASTVLGMATLVIFYWMWYRKAPSLAIPPEMRLRPALKHWWVSAMTALTLGLSFLYAWLRFVKFQRYQVFVIGFAIAFVTVTFTEFVVFSLWWRWTASKRSAA